MAEDDENDSYHSCHSSVSYGKEDSPGWDGDDQQGIYSDEGGYLKDGGEEGALYDEEEGGMYGDEGEYNYEDEEEMPYEEDEDMYPLDGTEDQEPPYTPTPTSGAVSAGGWALMPTTNGLSSVRPPLEKQPSLHQQRPAHDQLQPPSDAPALVSQDDKLPPFNLDSTKSPFTPTQPDLSTTTTSTPTTTSQVPAPDSKLLEPEPRSEVPLEERQPPEQPPAAESGPPAPEEKPEEPPVPW